MAEPTQFLTPADLPLYHQYYIDGVKDAAYLDNPFSGNTEKKPATGSSIQHTLKVEYGAGFGAIFATAQQYSSEDQLFRFQLPIARDYFIKQLQTHDVVLTESNSIESVMQNSIDSGLKKTANRFEQACWSVGFGCVGVISTATNTSGSNWTIVFDNTIAPVGLGIGFTLVSAVAGSSASLDTGNFTISTVNRATRTITGVANASWSGTNGHLMFAIGDKSTNTTPNLCIGVPGWIPLVAPVTGDSLVGPDRSVDPERMAGTRTDGRGKSIKQAIIESVSYARQVTSGSPDATYDACYLNPVQFGNLINQEGNKQLVVNKAKHAEVSYDSIDIYTGAGKTTVYSSSQVPPNAGWVLSSGVWEIPCPGGKIVRNVIAENPGTPGQLWTTLGTSDGIEQRWGWRAAVVCRNAAVNTVFQLA